LKFGTKVGKLLEVTREKWKNIFELVNKLRKGERNSLSVKLFTLNLVFSRRELIAMIELLKQQ